MQAAAISVFALLPMFAFGATQHGEWTMDHSDAPGKVAFGVYYSNGPENHSEHGSDWSKSDFKGLDFADGSKHNVHFEIDREAGTIRFQGFLQGDRGAGVFDFSSHSQYSREMNDLGFDFSNNKLFAATLYNVSTKIAKEMKALGVAGLDADKLIAFQIFQVRPEFVEEMRAAGVNARDADKLIAFRIHGVSPSFVHDLHDAGVKVSDADKLIAFRIFNVSPEFVQAIEKLGFAHPEPDKLIALRVQGVTSSYIEGLRSHGVHDLTLDQVIALHTQGIN